MNTLPVTKQHLGSGLIGIGREWGHIQTPIPVEEEVFSFLAEAINCGITYFDTAPSYGMSEERLGKFLSFLELSVREKLIIATKFGEHWDKETNQPFIDHSYDGLTKSLDQSLRLLKQIDILYLHKVTPEVLQNPDVAKAFTYAQTKGIKYFGASVSDIESAEFIINSDFYSVIQFPYNATNKLFESIIDKATQKNKIVVINRPFNMGKHATDKITAFTFILKKKFNGFILTGTKSPVHLEENVTAFQQAKTSLKSPST